MKSLRYVLTILLSSCFTNALAQDDSIYIYNKHLYFSSCPSDLFGAWCGYTAVLSIPSKDKRFSNNTYYFGFDKFKDSNPNKESLKEFEEEISIDTISLTNINDLISINPREFQEKLSLTKKIILVTEKGNKYISYRVHYQGTAKNYVNMALD